MRLRLVHYHFSQTVSYLPPEASIFAHNRTTARPLISSAELNTLASARPTHKRTLSPPMPFNPPPVFQPLSRVNSNASSFYFRSQPSVVGQIRRGHRAHDSVISAGGTPPVSLYNRGHHRHSHRRGESSGSVSSVALSYALHGANGGQATWAKHSRNDPSIDSMTSDYSVVRLSCPGLGDKMLDSEFGHGIPLSAISTSPNQSFDSGLYDQYQYEERTGFNSIMDTRVYCLRVVDGRQREGLQHRLNVFRELQGLFGRLFCLWQVG